MVIDAFQDCDNGILIRCHFEGKLFNLRRLQAKPKMQTDVLEELLYSDDMAKLPQWRGRYNECHKTVSAMISKSRQN